MSMLSIASRTALEAEREDSERKMALFLPQFGALKMNLPQSTPQIGLLCYTVSSGQKSGKPDRGIGTVEMVYTNASSERRRSGKPD